MGSANSERRPVLTREEEPMAVAVRAAEPRRLGQATHAETGQVVRYARVGICLSNHAGDGSDRQLGLAGPVEDSERPGWSRSQPSRGGGGTSPLLISHSTKPCCPPDAKQMMLPLGVAKSSQTGPGPHRSANRSGVVPGASVVEPEGEVVPVCVPVALGVVTVTVAVVVVVEPLDPPQAAAVNTAPRITTPSHPSECPRAMAGDCTGLQDISAGHPWSAQRPEHGDRRARRRVEAEFRPSVQRRLLVGKRPARAMFGRLRSGETSPVG